MNVAQIFGPVVNEMRAKRHLSDNVTLAMAKAFAHTWLAGEWNRDNLKAAKAFMQEEAGNDAWKSDKVIVSRVTRSIAYFGDRILPKHGVSIPDLWVKGDITTVSVSAAYDAVPKKKDERTVVEKLVRYIVVNGITDNDIDAAMEIIGKTLADEATAIETAQSEVVAALATI